MSQHLHNREMSAIDNEAIVDLNLIEAQRARAIVDVLIDGQDDNTAINYQSVILHVDPHAGSILIDELFPAGFSGLPGQPLTVGLRRADGSRTRFSTRIIKRLQTDGVDNYQLMLPNSVAYNQRREVFRLPLSREQGVVSEFQMSNRQICFATVQDISVTGIRMEVENPIWIETGDVLTDLDFEFERQRFHCQARVRHVCNDRLGKTVVGVAFHDLPRLQQRLLERILMQQQRRVVRESHAKKVSQATV